MIAFLDRHPGLMFVAFLILGAVLNYLSAGGQWRSPLSVLAFILAGPNGGAR